MNTYAKITTIFLVLFLFGQSLICKSQDNKIYENYAWLSKITNEHPRLFFNKESFAEVKKRALNDERELFEEMQIRVDLLVGKEIVFPDPLAKDGTNNSNHTYGNRAAESAFVYLVTGDKKYLDLTKNILRNLIGYYELRNENSLNIQWYSFSRINALAAYDWIYNDLTEEEREELGIRLFGAINHMISGDRSKVFRINNGNYKTGFYGPPNLPWFLGIVFYNSGFDNNLSEKLLKKGYDDHTTLLKYRDNASGDDGGAASSVLGYCMGAYPWAEFNFFHTFHSASGLDISTQWPYVPKFINYVFWNWLPGDKEFGYGDARHYDNKLAISSMHLHITQMTHFYGESQPELISLGKWMQQKLKKERRNSFPYTRFLLTNTQDELEAIGPSEKLPKARHFDNMGQLFMRSGSAENDTYSVFTAGGILTQHRHYDNNNFVIYKNGFVTVDTGTRPQPGLHLSHYYCRTVAHNCITVKMPGEVLPNYWGSKALSEEDAPVPNDGGQNNLMGSEIIAFDEKEEYVYIASDATKSYHKDKANLVLRQFVFLPPDHFVVFDRVNSVKPEYQKRWILHTATEPVIDGNQLYADHQEGRLFCKTLFPEKADLNKVGGPGKQFWSDGRNWTLEVVSAEDWNSGNMRWLKDDHDLFGQWRIEVTPEIPENDNIFLHLIQVGDTSLQSMVNAVPVKNDDLTGLRFEFEKKEYKVMFNTQNDAGGKITISQSGRKILEESFIDKVKSQNGLF